MPRPTGDPHGWTGAQWLAYNAWEAAQPKPPMWGPYENAQQYYSSDKWLEIMRYSLESHQLHLQMARQGGNLETIAFFEKQVSACERDLGIARPIAQGSLFELPDEDWSKI